mmetsp:Transcript_11293/g.35795  ORF Transcript_11293/g.35795 Transcript_11293/m.35795 type:complete len:235 (-) Transcript_11293:95-799(-)
MIVRFVGIGIVLVHKDPDSFVVARMARVVECRHRPVLAFELDQGIDADRVRVHNFLSQFSDTHQVPAVTGLRELLDMLFYHSRYMGVDVRRSIHDLLDQAKKLAMVPAFLRSRIGLSHQYVQEGLDVPCVLRNVLEGTSIHFGYQFDVQHPLKKRRLLTSKFLHRRFAFQQHSRRVLHRIRSVGRLPSSISVLNFTFDDLEQNELDECEFLECLGVRCEHRRISVQLIDFFQLF